MRTPRALLAGLLLLVVSTLPAGTQPRTVSVFNWNDYIDPYAVARFTQETGIRVRYDLYDSLETLEARLSAGRSGYDVVFPTAEPTFARLVQAGGFLPIDRARVPNWSGLDPNLMRQVESSDPGNRHGPIYLWGTIGLGLIPDRVRALAADAPLDSLSLIFDPAQARRVSRCGITMMDSAIDVIPTALRYLGRDPNSTDAADLQAVERLLLAIRPYVRNFSTGGVVNALAGGETCIAFAYSGDVIQAGVRAAEANRGVRVQYVVPREGAQLWFDVAAIPRDAPDPEAAHMFINFLLRPDVIAGITNHVRYPNAVPASRATIRPEIASDPNIYPDAATQARLFTVRAVPQAAERARTRVWARFKAGR
jgi:putrescine transport system substrate-binding protein